MSRDPVLLGDIGGTHARFALACGDGIRRQITLDVADHPTATDAIAEFLAGLAKDRCPGAAILACAGPVEAGVVSLTNSPWRLDAGEIEGRFGFSDVLLVNDFAAVAWALPNLRENDLRAVGGGIAKADRPAVVLGPGTGLGIATYSPAPKGSKVIVGEGGHGTLPATNDKEAEVIARLRMELGHVSAERTISGDGLVRLYETIAALEGLSVPSRTAAGISDAAVAGNCATSQAALDMFCAMLGSVAGNMALTMGAQGGVYIAGGIVPQIADYVIASDFRRCFEAKGRFQSYLLGIPTWIILHPEPAFLGLLRLGDERYEELQKGIRA